jgi:glycogen(starch) synthase
MRILFWSELAWPHIGGVETFTRILIEKLREQGHELTLVTSHAEAELSDERVEDGITVHRLPMHKAIVERRLDLLTAVRCRLIDAKTNFRPDVVHLNFPCPSAMLHWSTESRQSCPTLLAIHHWLGELPSGPDTLVGRSLANASWIVANSRATYASVAATDPKAVSRCSVVYNGISERIAALAPISWDPPRIVCLGRLIREKGFHIALRSFASVRRNFRTCRMIVAGDGPESGALQALASELGVRDCIEFTGWIRPERVDSLLGSAAMVLVPSQIPESFGLTALEAMRMGRPVIASNCGALPELISDSETGLLTPAGDPVALANAIARLLTDREFAARLGAAGHSRFLDGFRLERCVDGYERLYNQLRRRNHAHP